MPAAASNLEQMVHELTGHSLLAGLPVKDRRRISRKMEVVSLAASQVVSESSGAIRDVFFPLSAVLSLIGTTAEGNVVEIGQIGREGIAGVEAALRTVGQPLLSTTVQIPGTALRMSAEHFAREVDESSSLNRCVRRYMGFVFAQLELSVACNRHHALEERCARRLLTAQDLSGRTQVLMTQHQLAQLLGASRQSVDRVLQGLADEGILRLSRAKIQILDRQALKTRSCPCYRLIKRELDALLAWS